MFNTNVLLDVFQNRAAHYTDSARCVSLIAEAVHEGVISAHAVATLFYLIKKHADAITARESIEWILASYSIAPCNADLLRAAHGRTARDFEDAVVIESAARSGCDCILTRNTRDFTASPVKALAPADFPRGSAPV